MVEKTGVKVAQLGGGGLLKLDCQDSPYSLPGISDSCQGDRVFLRSLGSRIEHIGEVRTVTSPLGLGQEVITTQDCYVWADQNFQETAIVNKGPEGRQNPFIWRGAGIGEAMRRLRTWHSSQIRLCSLCSGIGRLESGVRKEPENKT
jgi:hypothetical protein